MVELRDEQILLLLRFSCCGDIPNKGGCPSPGALVEPNTNQRQRQYGETRHRDANRHPGRWHDRPGHYYCWISHDRSCPHCSEVQAEDREREEERTLKAVK